MKVEELINSDNLIVVDGEYTDDAIRQAYTEGYNQAIDDAVENIKLKLFDVNPYDDTCDGYRLIETSKPPLYTRGYLGYITGKVEINKDSILKLKK